MKSGVVLLCVAMVLACKGDEPSGQAKQAFAPGHVSATETPESIQPDIAPPNTKEDPILVKMRTYTGVFNDNMIKTILAFENAQGDCSKAVANLGALKLDKSKKDEMASIMASLKNRPKLAMDVQEMFMASLAPETVDRMQAMRLLSEVCVADPGFQEALRKLDE